MSISHIAFIICILLAVSGCQAQPDQDLCIMFYNVENLFHPDDAPGDGDDDFTPEGTRRWNDYRYYRKIAGISKVILGVNGWNPPAVVCLSEIENKQVLNDLIYHPLLSGYSYQLLHRDSPDHRGMDVGMLYRSDLLVCIDTSWITVFDEQGRTMDTREMISAGFTDGKDTMVVVGCHWSSKYGGALETEKFRIQQAHALGRFTDSLLTAAPGRILITGGDLNDFSGSAPVEVLEGSYPLKEVVPGGTFLSYKYQGNWGSIDHVFIGDHLDGEAFNAEIVTFSQLLEPDEKYSGQKPLRTYTGFRYNGGISDHLPLVLRLDAGKLRGN